MPKLAEAKEELMPALQQLAAQVASIVQQQVSTDDAGEGDGGAEQAEGAEGGVEIKVEVQLGDGEGGNGDGDKDGNDEDDGRGEG
eukprot:COSAG04_NODE_1640_length_6081_cov_25.385599_8_plen_85_part_00